MKEPCIAIDVSKGNSHIQGFEGLDEPIGKAIKITHDIFGLEHIEVLSDKLFETTNRRPIIVFEATGVYDAVIQKYVVTKNYRFIKMNPLKASKVRKQELRAVKTDQRDCISIAKAFYTMYFEETKEVSENYISLKQLNRYYATELDHLRKCKIHFHEVLDIVFPSLSESVADVFNDAILGILEKYKHPDILMKAQVRHIALTIEKSSCHRKSWCEKKAIQLKEYANTYLSGCNINSVNVAILLGRIEDVRYHQRKVITILEEMETLSQDIIELKILQSVPGIGKIIALQILAEIGEIHHFENHKKLIAFAGVDPRVYQSGQYGGNGLSITKKGSKHLRTAIYMAVRAHLRFGSETSAIKKFHKKKMQQGKPPKVASIACCNKLLKIIYYLLINGCFYSEQ